MKKNHLLFCIILLAVVIIGCISYEKTDQAKPDQNEEIEYTGPFEYTLIDIPPSFPIEEDNNEE
jgi:PBP1b-binding outer membrane lipoprotein LpoB